MHNKSRRPLGERALHKLSKYLKGFTRGQSPVDPVDHPSSVPSNTQHPQFGVATPAQSVHSIMLPVNPTTNLPGISTERVGDMSIRVNEASFAVPVASSSVPMHGLADSSSAAQNIKIAAKGALWVLSSAAEGVPIPGAKAIFDVISKVIEAIEVSGVILFSSAIF